MPLWMEGAECRAVMLRPLHAAADFSIKRMEVCPRRKVNSSPARVDVKPKSWARSSIETFSPNVDTVPKYLCPSINDTSALAWEVISINMAAKITLRIYVIRCLPAEFGLIQIVAECPARGLVVRRRV